MERATRAGVHRRRGAYIHMQVHWIGRDPVNVDCMRAYRRIISIIAYLHVPTYEVPTYYLHM